MYWNDGVGSDGMVDDGLSHVCMLCCIHLSLVLERQCRIFTVVHEDILRILRKVRALYQLLCICVGCQSLRSRVTWEW